MGHGTISLTVETLQEPTGYSRAQSAEKKRKASHPLNLVCKLKSSSNCVRVYEGPRVP